MKTVALAITAILLSGCVTATLDKIDAAIQHSAPAACKALKIAYDGFTTSGKGSVSDKAAVNDAYAAAKPICDNPSQATASQLVKLGDQLDAIYNTLRKVKAGK